MPRAVYQLNLFDAREDRINLDHWRASEPDSIATLPAQGLRSCEAVLATVFEELEQVHSALSNHYGLCKKDLDGTRRFNADFDGSEEECEYAAALDDAAQLMDLLRTHWPSLRIAD